MLLSQHNSSKTYVAPLVSWVPAPTEKVSEVKVVSTAQSLQLAVRFGVKLRYTIRAVVGSASE